MFFSAPEIYDDVIAYLLQTKVILTLLKNKSLVNCFLQERDATMFFIEKMIVGKQICD